jgi:hypothetical protein
VEGSHLLVQVLGQHIHLLLIPGHGTTAREAHSTAMKSVTPYIHETATDKWHVCHVQFTAHCAQLHGLWVPTQLEHLMVQKKLWRDFPGKITCEVETEKSLKPVAFRTCQSCAHSRAPAGQ